MAKGRGFHDIRGSISLGDSMSATQWKGMLVLRHTPIVRQDDVISPVMAARRSQMTEITRRWTSVLTELQRAKWEALAKMLGSAYTQEKHLTTGQAGHIIPRQGVLMSGFNVYVRSNMLLASSGMTYPRDEAPFSTSIPPAPSLKYAGIETSPDGETGLAIDIEGLNMGIFKYEKVMRIWLKVLAYGVERKPTLEMVSTSMAPGRIILTGFKGTKPFGKELVKFSELGAATVTVEGEVIVSDSPKHGVFRSAGSGVIPVTFTNPETKDVDKMRQHLVAYRKRMNRRTYLRRVAHRIVAVELADRLLEREERRKGETSQTS